MRSLVSAALKAGLQEREVPDQSRGRQLSGPPAGTAVCQVRSWAGGLLRAQARESAVTQYRCEPHCPPAVHRVLQKGSPISLTLI